MNQYTRYSLALTEEENKKLKAVQEGTRFGVKKIFMAMVEELYKPIAPFKKEEEI